MPVFDLTCAVCGTDQLDVFTHRDLPQHCGQTMTKLWLQGSFPSVSDDSIPGGMVIENLTPTPITVYSKTEHRLVMKQHGASPKVRHVGEPGSDKSKHTTRWV